MKRSIVLFVVRYGLAIGLTLLYGILVTLKEVGQGFTGLIFLVVFLSARYGGRGPGLFATGLLTFLAILSLSKDKRPIEVSKAIQLAILIASGPLITSLVEAMAQARRAAEDHAREAARQSERLRTTLQSIGDAVIVTDLNGRVVSLNPVAETLTGWPQSMAEGRPLGEIFVIIDDQTRRPVENPVERVLSEGKILGLANHTLLVSRDGTARPIDDSAAPIRGARDQLMGVVLVFRDISTRRASERSLAAAEARFRAFMDHSPIVAFLKDAQGRYLWGNAAWSRLHESRGFTAIGETDFSLWPRETATLLRRSDLAALKSNFKVEVIEPTKNPDGSETHWMTLKFPVDDEDNTKLVGGIAVDVTHRIVAEQALRESEARYRLLFDSNPHPMWVFQIDSLAFLAVNEAAVQHYGYSRGEFLAMSIHDIRPKDDLLRLHDWVGRLRQMSLSAESYWRHRKKDGTIIDVEIASHSIDFEGHSARVVLVHDITVRRLAEEALRINRERLDLVINGASLGLWYCDLPGAALTLNERAKTHFGLEPGDSLSLSAYVQRVHPEDRERTREAIGRAIELREPFDVEHRVPVDEKKSRWVRAIGQAFFDDAGAAIRFDGISIDVTNRKAAEEQLREAKEAAIVANNAKSKFLAMIGHELRTPLTPILASVSTILNASDANDEHEHGWSKSEIRDLLIMIRRNVELETRLIGDLLDISRVERGQLRLEVERVDLHDAIRQAVDICRDAILVSGINVSYELSATKYEVKGDHARIMQIIWNLVHNAAKFTTANGRLTIRTYNSTSELLNSESHKLYVEFEDNGIGIEAELLGRIFAPFDQGELLPKSRMSGLGLGLAISRSIAEAHGGDLTAMSAGRSKGSTFRLVLDVLSTPRPLAESHLTEHPHQQTNLRILLVEDNADTLRYLAILLRQRGYQVETSRRLDEAMAQASAIKFDVVISDIELPDGSGLELMRQLRGQVVGIAMSGFGSESDIEVSHSAGFATHLTKPIDVNRLIDAIHEAIVLDK